MQLDLTTFLMEIANFLVLVWILNRLLYRPVRAVIAERQSAMARDRAEAENMRNEAAELRKTYQGRLASWDAEKTELRLRLQAEIAAERQRLLASLEQELDGMREKARITEERRGVETARLNEERAVAGACRFASRLLARVASPKLEKRLIEMLLEDIAAFREEQRRAISGALESNGAEVQVVTAYPLAAPAAEIFATRFRTFFPTAGQLRFSVDADLLAGIRVTAGPWNLSANLKEELAFFCGGINAA